MNKVLFLSNHATYFASHRFEIAKCLMKKNISVSLFCGSKTINEEHVHEKLRLSGMTVRICGHRSGSKSLLSLLIFFFNFIFFLKRERPDLIHCVSIKAMIIGLIYAKIGGPTRLIIALSGLGSLLTLEPGSSRFFIFRKLLIHNLLKILMQPSKNITYIVQNNEDKLFLIDKLNIKDDKIELIAGSGVDLAAYYAIDSKDKKNVVLMASRLLKNKGVVEFLLAVQKLRAKYPNWIFKLAGAIDEDSPASCTKDELDNLISSSGCQPLGHVTDIPNMLKEVSIFVLPSYREGFPKVLMEASAASCAIITTSVPGCADAVRFGDSGLLIEPKNVNALIDAIADLIDDRERRNTLADSARQNAVRNFSIQKVVERHLEIYGV